MGIKTSNAFNIDITAFFHWQVPRIKLFSHILYERKTCKRITATKKDRSGFVFYIFIYFFYRLFTKRILMYTNIAAINTALSPPVFSLAGWLVVLIFKYLEILVTLSHNYHAN